MTDESAFQAALDADPSNPDLRLVFADWLEEQGDWRAAGYRWMGQHRKHPYPTSGSWDWWDIRLREKLTDRVVVERAEEILDHIARQGAVARPTAELLGHVHEVRLTTRLKKKWLLASMIASEVFSLLESEINRGPKHREYASRRDADEALCAVLQKLADFSLDTAPTRR